MGVKGNAFRELTLVAGPNVSDGFLSSSSSSTSFRPPAEVSPRSPAGSSTACYGPRRIKVRAAARGSCSRFLESLISVPLVLFPCRSSPLLENRCPRRGGAATLLLAAKKPTPLETD